VAIQLIAMEQYFHTFYYAASVGLNFYPFMQRQYVAIQFSSVVGILYKVHLGSERVKDCGCIAKGPCNEVCY